MWDSLGEIAQSLLDIAFSLFGFNIDLGNMGLTAKEFCDWNTITASEFGTLAEILNSAFVSLGLNLLTVFVMIDLIKKAMEIDRISWERIIMSVARFLIFKMLITYSYEFLNMIMKIGNEFTNTVINTINFQTGTEFSIGEMIKELIDTAEGGITIPIINWSIMPFVLFVVFIIIYLPLIGTFVMCISQIVTRVIKIVLAFAFAPIPLAIGTWEDGSGTGKRFIMNAVALAFEGMIMILCVHIYALGIADLQNSTTTFGGGIGAMIGILLMNGILSTAFNNIFTVSREMEWCIVWMILESEHIKNFQEWQKNTMDLLFDNGCFLF